MDTSTTWFVFGERGVWTLGVLRGQAKGIIYSVVKCCEVDKKNGITIYLNKAILYLNRSAQIPK
jgi:hypothetical protein